MSQDAAWRARILRERAERLAQRPAPVVSADTVRALTCAAGGGAYAFPIESLARVAPFTRPARLAGAPPACLGLMNRGGDFVLVYDLAQTLGLAPADADGGVVLLLRATGVQTGIRVDRAGSVETLSLIGDSERSGIAPPEVASGHARAADGRTLTLIDPNIMLERLRSLHA